MRDTVYIDGRFAGQPLTGVQRVAWHMTYALDELAPHTGKRWVFLCAPGSPRPTLRNMGVREVGRRVLHPHLWVQAVLPFAARDGLLLNFTGAAPWFGGPLACVIHDAAVFDHPQAYTTAFTVWYRRLFRRIARRAEVLFTVSEFSRSRLALHLPRPMKDIVVVPNGADHLQQTVPDPTELHRSGLRDKDFFLAVGSANPAKNLPLLLEAFERVAALHDVFLVVVGGANPRVYASQGTCGSNPRVRYLGQVCDATLKALYSQARALVFPSLHEGFGLPPGEAMACGCPVIVSRIPALRELCGTAALYVDPRSVSSVATALDTVMTHPAVRESMQLAGFERARSLTWNAAAHGLLRGLGLGCHGESAVP